MAVIRSLTVKIGADLTSLQKGLNDAKKSISRFGRDMTSAGETLTKSLTVPIAGMTAALGKIGFDFDDAFDKIRTSTGATGDTLKGLEDSFKSVMKQVPNSMEEVSTAISDLNTRTGLTGPALETLSTQFLTLAKITGEDVATTIASSTRLFGDWSVAANDSGNTLDHLFKVSQSTGIGVTSLSDKLVQFGAPLRQLGFDFETSAALIGKFEKEGVNTELVLGGLRIALGKMSREGITDTKAALIEVTQRIKDAGSTGEANALALELFGARVGPDMAAAIREGRFEIDEFLSTLSGSTETISNAAADTYGFAENLQIIKNNLLTALEPLGTQLIGALDAAMPVIENLIANLANLVEWFTTLDPSLQTIIVSILGVLAAAGPMLIVIGKISTGIASIIPLISGLLSPIGLVVLAIAALIAIFVTLWNTNETFRIGITKLWTEIKDVAVKVFNVVKDVIKLSFELARSIIDVFVKWASAIWNTYGSTITKVTETVFNTIKGLINAALTVIKGILNTFIGLFTGDWTRFKDGLTQVWQGLWNGIKTILDGAWGLLKGAFSSLLTSIKNWFTGLISDAYDWGKDIIDGLIDGIKSMSSRAISAAKNVATGIKNAVKDFFGIASPSKLMEDFGRQITAGLEIGINQMNLSPLKNIDLKAMPQLGLNPFPEETLIRNDRKMSNQESLQPLSSPASDGISVNFYAPVYGLLDFEKQVKQIVKEAAINGAFRGVL